MFAFSPKGMGGTSAAEEDLREAVFYGRYHLPSMSSGATCKLVFGSTGDMRPRRARPDYPTGGP